MQTKIRFGISDLDFINNLNLSIIDIGKDFSTENCTFPEKLYKYFYEI